MKNSRTSYMRCTACGAQYLGSTQCPSCNEMTGKSMGSDGEDVTKKTFDAPDLMKAGR